MSAIGNSPDLKTSELKVIHNYILFDLHLCYTSFTIKPNSIALRYSFFPVTYFILLPSTVCFTVSASSSPFSLVIYSISATFNDMLHSLNRYFGVPTMCQKLGCKTIKLILLLYSEMYRNFVINLISNGEVSLSPPPPLPPPLRTFSKLFLIIFGALTYRKLNHLVKFYFSKGALRILIVCNI